jgi:hypothetical protein
MNRLRYVGTKHTELVGQTAIVVGCATAHNEVRVQFDDANLRSNVILETRHKFCRHDDSHGGKLWGFGHHDLPATDFEPVE